MLAGGLLDAGLGSPVRSESPRASQSSSSNSPPAPRLSSSPTDREPPVFVLNAEESTTPPLASAKSNQAGVKPEPTAIDKLATQLVDAERKNKLAEIIVEQQENTVKMIIDSNKSLTDLIMQVSEKATKEATSSNERTATMIVESNNQTVDALRLSHEATSRLIVEGNKYQTDKFCEALITITKSLTTVLKPQSPAQTTDSPPAAVASAASDVRAAADQRVASSSPTPVSLTTPAGGTETNAHGNTAATHDEQAPAARVPGSDAPRGRGRPKGSKDSYSPRKQRTKPTSSGSEGTAGTAGTAA